MNKTRVAIPIWSGRVCTVFDFAQRLLIVDLDGGKELERKEYVLENVPPLIRASRLLHLNVQVLICGAISSSLASLVSKYGIKIIPSICGDIDEVLNAYITGSLATPRFRLPGYTPTPGGYWKGHRRFRG
ncbi:unnamed protein product, partial [marine sediment metagenome]